MKMAERFRVGYGWVTRRQGGGPLDRAYPEYERLPLPQCTGRRCDSDVVLATVTGESNLSLPLAAHAAGKARGGHRSGSQETGCGGSVHEAWKKGSFAMAATAATTPHVVPVPLWAWALVAFALFSVFVITQENGAILSAAGAEYLHELTHDARHALGVPCH